MQKIFMPTAVLPISQYDIICTPMLTNRLRARPDPMLSRMVRAAHPVFTRMVRRSPLSSSFSRMVRKPNYLRMVPAAFREEPLETGILSHTHQLQVPGERGGSTLIVSHSDPSFSQDQSRSTPLFPWLRELHVRPDERANIIPRLPSARSARFCCFLLGVVSFAWPIGQ